MRLSRFLKESVVSARGLSPFVGKMISAQAINGNLARIMTRYFAISIASAGLGLWVSIGWLLQKELAFWKHYVKHWILERQWMRRALGLKQGAGVSQALGSEWGWEEFHVAGVISNRLRIEVIPAYYQRVTLEVVFGQSDSRQDCSSLNTEKGAPRFSN